MSRDRACVLPCLLFALDYVMEDLGELPRMIDRQSYSGNSDHSRITIASVLIWVIDIVTTYAESRAMNAASNRINLPPHPPTISGILQVCQ
jgi:hypothetical protein